MSGSAAIALLSAAAGDAAAKTRGAAKRSGRRRSGRRGVLRPVPGERRPRCPSASKTFTEAGHAFFNDTGTRFNAPAAEEA